MKNLIIFLVLLISTPIFSFAQKQLQKGEDGTFRLKPEIATDYHNTNLTVSICAEEYLEYIPDLLMLGKGDTLIVNMDTIKKFVGMVGFWKYKESSFYSQGITLVGNEVECTGPCFKDSEIRTAWFVILMVISVVLMILSDILGKEFFAKHSFLFAFFTIFVYAAYVIVSAATISAFVAAAIVFCSAPAKLYDGKRFVVSSIIFYLSSILFFIFLHLA